MESKNCPVFLDTDKDLGEKIKECELKGTGYAIEVTDLDAYLMSAEPGFGELSLESEFSRNACTVIRK